MDIPQPSESGSISTKSGHPKLLIPRLAKSRVHEIHYYGGVEKKRVTHACEPCREKKTKCDGDKPSCLHCQISGATCHYGDGKRERAKKNLKTLEGRISVLEELIQDIQPYLSSTGQLAVQKVLLQSQYPQNRDTSRRLSTSINSASSYEFSQHNSEGSAGESFLSTWVRSVSPFDCVTGESGANSITNPSGYLEKANSVTNSSGCLEKAKEVLWIHHISKELEKAGHNQPVGVLGLPPSHEATGVDPSGREMELSRRRGNQGFSLGGLEAPAPLRQVDMFSLPPRSVADELIHSYFATVHPLFPIICKPHFMVQFNTYYSSLEQQSLENSRKWLTVLNLVFAIGDRYLESEMGIEGREGREEKKDVDYFMRSRVLGALDGGSVFETPDLGKVQALGLTGIYLLASVQTNRAWNIIGLAIRLAYGIGLHLRNDSIVEVMQKKMRLRIWYCLCCLEINLCLITGRPCAIQDGNYNAPCPSDLNDEILPSEYGNVSTLDIYFSKHQSLTVISADMLYKLYSAKLPRNKDWLEVQDLLQGLSARLEQWRIGLPLVLDFLKEEVDYIFRRQRLNLAFQYYTIQMLINRPCLWPFEIRTPNESSESTEFQKLSAAKCISSARAIIHLIVDEPDHRNLVGNSPWWCLLHYLMPAKAIIMLEMIYQTMYTPEDKAALFSDGKMVLDWLRKASGVGTSKALQGHILELSNQLKKVAQEIEVQFMDRGEHEAKDTSSHIPTSTGYQSSLPFSASSVAGDISSEIFGGSPYNPQEQFFNITNPLTWWSTQSDRDLIMADAPVVTYGRLQGQTQQVDINLWFDREEGV